MIRYLKIFWKYRVSNYENVTQLHSLTFELKLHNTPTQTKHNIDMYEQNSMTKIMVKMY